MFEIKKITLSGYSTAVKVVSQNETNQKLCFSSPTLALAAVCT
jgi:hypothetical protein